MFKCLSTQQKKKTVERLQRQRHVAPVLVGAETRVNASSRKYKTPTKTLFYLSLSAMEALQTSSSLGSPRTHACCNPSIQRTARLLQLSYPSVSPRGLGLRFLGLDPHRRLRIDVIRPIIVSASSHKEEPHPEIEVDRREELKIHNEESQEEWQKTLESFKEQAMKMKATSQETYEVYSEKAMIILMETSKQLKIQAERARHDLSIIANEVSEESKEYLIAAAENAPEPLKDVVETFSSASELKAVSEVRDFHLGIPFGLLLSVGGFLDFMLTGSISAIRFGVILGGTLLAVSVSSLRSWKHGEGSVSLLKGQAAIAAIIFIRELRLLSQRPSLPTTFVTLVSGMMVVFYLYRIALNVHKDGPTSEQTPEN